MSEVKVVELKIKVDTKKILDIMYDVHEEKRAKLDRANRFTLYVMFAMAIVGVASSLLGVDLLWLISTALLLVAFIVSLVLFVLSNRHHDIMMSILDKKFHIAAKEFEEITKDIIEESEKAEQANDVAKDGDKDATPEKEDPKKEEPKASQAPVKASDGEGKKESK